MRIFKLFIGLYALMLLPGCSTSDKSLSKEEKRDSLQKLTTSNPENQDTTLAVNIHGKILNLKINKFEIKRIRGIEETANSFINRHKEPDSVNTSYIDFTGDGKPEKVIAHIFKYQNEFKVMHFIYQSEKLIYSDTLDTFDPNDNDNDWYHKDDTAYAMLEPYTSLYDGFKLIALGLNQRASEFNTEETVDLRKTVLISRHLSHTDIAQQTKIFQDYLKNFKGKLLTINTEVSGIMMWYEPEKQFINLQPE